MLKFLQLALIETSISAVVMYQTFFQKPARAQTLKFRQVRLNKSKKVYENGRMGQGNPPDGRCKKGLESLTITKGDMINEEVFYVLVERYCDSVGLRNHGIILNRDVSSAGDNPFLSSLSLCSNIDT